jgi:hypothetical protein
MDSSTEGTVIGEELWRTWSAMGKRRHREAARKLRVIAGFIIAGLSAVGCVVYFVFMK